ncbi:MAG: undecaprenyldiphospho-muramoylpentapeptide beta-N-acetylglucosaminyltransferase [Ignavibacteria bacterium]|nr:undecaprenyldiphospho-muramoylpentapeptide beta-N-acetylglucosaminyltransferase [Ignavibacteria bacterium]
MRFVMTGGGTGGHIFPAIAIADGLMERYNDAEILFIGAKGKMEEKVVPENNYNIKLIEVSGFNRKNPIRNFKFLRDFFNSMAVCKKILKEFKPDAVIGTGGYVSGPVVYSAIKMGIPSILQEGNSFPGKVTKSLSGKASRVIVNFEETISYLKRKDNVVRISYPVRSRLKLTDKQEAKKYFGFDNSGRTLFVFGGSQGASGINKSIMKILDALDEKNINLIWQVGKLNYETINKELAGKYNKVKVLDFIKEIDMAYSAADLVVCRAGISSIMELSLLRKPAVLVPYPFAAENHQEKNAVSMVKMNAAVMIKESVLDENLLNSIREIIFDDNKLAELGSNASLLYDRNAPEKIVDEIIKTIN